jgi:undecaprenyl-diphosphatase
MAHESGPEPRRRSRAEAVARMLESAWREWPVLAGLLLAAAAFWAFIELADEVREGATSRLDRAILIALRSSADPQVMLGPRWLHEMVRDFTGLGGTGVLTLVTLSVSAYLVLEGKRQEALVLLVAVGGGLLISTLLKAGFDRPRPDLVPHGSIVMTASFPSGHSMLSAVTYLTLGAISARLREDRRVKIYIIVVAVLTTMLVGISRIYLGVHWPTDVLAGWTIGAAWALLCWFSTLFLQARGLLKPS